MSFRGKLVRTALCLSQASLLLLSTTSSAFAVSSESSQLSSADGARLDRFEHILFGYSKSNLSTESRLKGIETNVFGSSKSGAVSARLNAVAKALGNRDQNYLLPPMAAKMDTPAAPAPAPQVNSQPYDQSSQSARSYEPPVADDRQDDQVKSALAQAVQLYSQGRTDDAERAFQRVVSLDSKNVDAYYNLGVIAEGKGNLNDALTNYRKAAKLNPGDSSLADAVSGVQGKLDSQQKAVAQAREIQKQNQTKQELKGLVADASSAYKAGNFDKAISDLRTVSQQAPNDPDVQYALAQAYRGKGQMQQARGCLSKAVSLDPNNQLYRTALADLDNSQTANSAGGGGGSGYNNNNNSNSNNYPGSAYQGGGYGNMASGGSGAGDSGPAGQLTPFTPTDSSGRYFEGRTAQNYGYGGGGPSIRYGGFGGLGGMSLGGMGGPRLKRAAVGGLAGAAVGALWGGTTHGSIKRDAIRGALVGGVLGLLSGRY